MNKKKKFIILISALCFMFLTGFSVSAEYKLEVSIPGQSGAEAGDKVGLADYIRYLYLFGLGAVGVLALGSLVYGGFLYMFADTITSKDQAREYIQGAIFGLILGLAAYLILYTINPNLVNLSQSQPDFDEINAGDSSTYSDTIKNMTDTVGE